MTATQRAAALIKRRTRKRMERALLRSPRISSPANVTEKGRVVFTVVPERPYSLALTAERYTRFPEIVDRFDGAVYRRLLPVDRRGVLLCVTQAGPPGRAVLEVTLSGAAARSPAARSAARRVVEGALGSAQPDRKSTRLNSSHRL